MEKLEEAKKVLQNERKITPEKLALKLNISMTLAYYLFKLLREWCNESGQCEEVKEGKKSMLVLKETIVAEPEKQQYKLLEKSDKIEIYDVADNVDPKEFYEKVHNIKTELIEKSKDEKINILSF